MSTIEKAAAKLVSKKKTVQPSESVADKSDIQTPAIAVQVSEIDNKTAENAAPATVLHQTCELDFEMLAENGFLVPGHDNPQQSQEFRRIKRPLLLNQQPKIAAELPLPTNVIFITSAMPGEGKTFVSLNLALSLAAELDKRVLLIDGDAAKQDLSRWMGIAEQPGLVDLLTSGKPYAESSIIDTNVERLQVMPCGSMADNLDELYASRLMDTLLSGLASFDSNRILIVDGPPLIATTEAAVLARRMGQVVLVVEANKTPQSAVEQAAAQLESCQLVSTLLNKATGSSNAGYGYGYGYGYGQHAKNSE
jgi:exopolysaccharide/PEP-CTERM locus tyrosine autokinase